VSTRSTNLQDAVRTRLWPLPTIAVVFALVLGLTVPHVDAAIDDDLPSWLNGSLFGGDADAARSLLGAIASSLITVTALTFSLTVVTLQLASSQFSPRLLRTFTRDLFVQVTLALFLATFTYSLTVLRAVRGSGDDGRVQLVPQVAVTLAFVLAVASVLGLVLFLAHLTEQIRVETMLRNVHRDAVVTMESVLDARDTAGGDRTSLLQAPPDAHKLLVPGNGFLNQVDRERILAVATETGVAIELLVHPGSFLVQGTLLGRVWPTESDALSDETVETIAGRVAGCIHLGFERTSTQDVGYGLRQLTDVANKALSPGINDPTTAIHALGHISAFLCALSGYDLTTVSLRDEQGRVRVALHRPNLADYVDLGLSQPRRYGAADPQVLQQIYQVLLDLSQRVTPDQRGVVRDELERLRGTAASRALDLHERAGLESMDRQVELNLQHSGAEGDLA
jgi:uncharacterized membrane protein